MTWGLNPGWLQRQVYTHCISPSPKMQNILKYMETEEKGGHE